MPDLADCTDTCARHIVVTGRVQGVGYRPFVYRLAQEMGLAGTVQNRTGEVHILAEGSAELLDAFESALITQAPPLAQPELAVATSASPLTAGRFAILPSEEGEAATIHVPPDLFCCDDCLSEMNDPAERRYRYPFTNCTQCGPRYTIIAALPYDRPATAMADFPLCPDCAAEYSNPLDRRFHAQPLACPECGPQLSCGDLNGEAALEAALAALSAGQVVAVKGVGGYHLMCDAANDDAIARLRSRKRRPDKPLAVMVPQMGADGLDWVRRLAQPDAVALAALAAPERAIVLVSKREDAPLGKGIAPGLDDVGLFLPYSPLHHLLIHDFGVPLVATSGNVSGEPVLTDSTQAEQRLAEIADCFLHHDRPILRPADDSVMRVIASKARPIRIGRGMAPLELALPLQSRQPLLATGGQMKNAVALACGNKALLSSHIGDLDSPRSLEVFEQVIADLSRLYRIEPRAIACDMHPGYASTRWAEKQGLPLVRVQHHHAHASALAGEHEAGLTWLVFAWDGTGYGLDGTIWGGETLLGQPGAWQRLASLREFAVLGGDRAAREPWRSAAALMWQAGHDWTPCRDGADLARAAWAKRMGTFAASSVGRLFDAAACLVLGLDDVTYEAQAPARLEALARSWHGALEEAAAMPIVPDASGLLLADWSALLPIIADTDRPPAQRAALFHESLSLTILAHVDRIARDHAFDAVGLTGGVFQNRLLAERLLSALHASGTRAHMPERLPTNDGGLAFGQLVEASAVLAA